MRLGGVDLVVEPRGDGADDALDEVSEDSVILGDAKLAEFGRDDRAAVIGRNAIEAEVLAFGHKATEDLRAAGLTLWGRDDGYYVSNIEIIVPRVVGGSDQCLAEIGPPGERAAQI